MKIIEIEVTPPIVPPFLGSGEVKIRHLRIEKANGHVLIVPLEGDEFHQPYDVESINNSIKKFIEEV